MKNLTLENIADAACRVFDEQTGEELQDLKDHFGTAYSEAKMVGLLTAQMLARWLDLPIGDDVRGISPLASLVDRGLQDL